MTTATDKELKTLKGEFASLKSDVAEIGESISTIAKSSAQEGQERAKAMARNGKERVNRAADKSAGQMRSGWDAIEGEVEQRPLTSLGIAMGLGFVIGKLLGR